MTRACIAVVMTSGAGLAFAGGARADLLPVPPPVPAPGVVLPSAAPAPGAAGGGALPVKVDLAVPILEQAPQVPSVPLPPVSTPQAPAELTAGLVQVSVGVKNALGQVGQATAGTPLSILNTSGDPAAVADVAADLDPLATACVQATGTGTALANVDLAALGADLGTPLVRSFPGFLASCPANRSAEASDPGAGSGGGSGKTLAVAGADATAGSLMGACARVTSSGVPLGSTVVLLDRDLAGSLASEGLPLDQLLVACPTDATEPGTGDTGNGGDDAGTAGGTGGSGGTDAGTGEGVGAAGAGSAASGFPSLGGSLPFAGAQVSLFLTVASALLAVGAAMVARARRAGLAAVRLS